jgi:hypothetical protein
MITKNSLDELTKYIRVDSNGLGIIGTITNHPLSIRTNDTERLRITGDGTVQVTTAGQGLKLPNSASSDTTTLDWYEEGTWTPAIVGGTTTGTASYTTQVGRYTRIGNNVTVHFNVAGTFSVAPTGEVRISGLPFTSQNTTGLFPTGALNYEYGVAGLNIYSQFNTAYLKVYKNSTATGSNGAIASFSTDYSNSNFSIQGTLTYQV